jgi:hypothetical protein
MKLNKEEYDFFKAALLKNTSEDQELPAEIETDTVYRFERFRYGSRGYEGLQFFVKKDEAGSLFLDYYFVLDDSKSHFRIDHTGNLIRLENFEGQWGMPSFEDEEETRIAREKIINHNQKVREILVAKGFEQK